MLRLWFLILCVLAGAFAPSRAPAREFENRTKDFFAFSPKTHQETDSQAVESHQEKSAHDYEIASGYPQAAERIPGVCFVAGTVVTTATGAQPIESLQVGDRVLTNDINAEATEVDPEKWRKITLKMPNPEHPSDILDLELLRSESWMQEVSCEEGARIWFNLDEMGLHGWADVVAVEPCPPIQSGPGRVVLATVTHFNSFVMEVRLADVAEVLQPTDRHRLFSVTRNDWVPSSQLKVGEELATKTGVARIESIKPKAGTHRVYNIEVETEHCFYAGAAQVLSHNNNPCAMVPGGRPPNLTPPGAGRTGALREALRQEGVPTSQQPSRVLPNLDRRGNVQPGRVYEYDVPAPGGGTRTVRIRDDAGGHNFGPNDPQNRGSHFNDSAGGHYDY